MPFNSLVPSRDDLPDAERETEAQAGVELLPLVLGCIGVIEPARIIDDGSTPVRRLRATADEKIRDREWDARGWRGRRVARCAVAASRHPYNP